MDRFEAKEFVRLRRKELEDLGQTLSVDMMNQILAELREQHKFVCYLFCSFAGGNVAIKGVYQDDNGMMYYIVG